MSRKARALRLLLLLSTVCSSTLADVQFTVPSAGETISAGTTISVEWEESGLTISAYTIQLMVGGNDESTMVSGISRRSARWNSKHTPSMRTLLMYLERHEG